jgi:hypothetical protein
MTDFLQQTWYLVRPVFAQLWALAHDPLGILVMMVFVCIGIWAYQTSVRLGR